MTNQVYTNNFVHVPQPMWYTYWTCPCGKQYVGRTIWSFTARVTEHINKINLGVSNIQSPDTTGGMLRDPTGILSPHGGAEPTLEVYPDWILSGYTSYSPDPPQGMNVEWDINSFINRA